MQRALMPVLRSMPQPYTGNGVPILRIAPACFLTINAGLLTANSCHSLVPVHEAFMYSLNEFVRISASVGS